MPPRVTPRRSGIFGRGFMVGDGMGARGFGKGRKLASVDLQLLMLGLLAGKPRHGYEIIKTLEERSNGFYAPSPGMVYPGLTHLAQIGHATVEIEGVRKRYHITAAGRSHLEGQRAEANALFEQFGRVGERMERVRRAMRAEEAGDAADTGHERHGSRELLRARRELEAALADKWDASREEQHRLVEILKRVCAEILRQ